MPGSVPIENVQNVRFLSVRGGLKTQVKNTAGNLVTIPVTMEVYTGVVLPDFGDVSGTGTEIFRDELRSFVPFEPMSVKAYPHGSIKDVTAMASPASFAGEEDEAVIVGVDTVVSVKLELQGFGNQPECLVMRVSLAALNATIYRYTYQVTLLVEEGANIEELDPLNAGDSPQ